MALPIEMLFGLCTWVGQMYYMGGALWHNLANMMEVCIFSSRAKVAEQMKNSRCCLGCGPG